MFLKQYNTEKVNSSVASCNETIFQNWVWHILSVISTIEIASINNFIIDNKLIFLEIDLITDICAVMAILTLYQLTEQIFA